MNIHHYRNLHLETFPATNRQVSHELNRLGAEGLLDPLAGTGSATETSKKNFQTARKHSETMVFVFGLYCIYFGTQSGCCCLDRGMGFGFVADIAGLIIQMVISGSNNVFFRLTQASNTGKGSGKNVGISSLRHFCDWGLFEQTSMNWYRIGKVWRQ